MINLALALPVDRQDRAISRGFLSFLQDPSNLGKLVEDLEGKEKEKAVRIDLGKTRHGLGSSDQLFQIFSRVCSLLGSNIEPPKFFQHQDTEK